MVCFGWILFMLGFFTAGLLAAAKRGDRKLAEKGTRENPFDNIQDAFGYSNAIKNHKGPISYQFPIKDLDMVSKNKDNEINAEEFFDKIKDIKPL